MDKHTFLEQPAFALFRQAYAERKAPLVVVCGSGLSTPAKLPTWGRLRDQLVKESENKYRVAGAIGQEMLNPKLEAIKRQKDYWVSFKLIKEFLGKPMFDSLVERELTPRDDAEIPESYLQILQLKPAGLVTLNLDKFAGEALSCTETGPVTPIYGTELGRKWGALRAAKTFLVYLHGGLHDPSTWVMTQDDLEQVSATEAYNLFLKTLFADYLVLFVGIGADDIALSKRLMQLTGDGFQPRNLYWLTSRAREVESWANSASIKLIEYSAKTTDEHTKVITALVEDCRAFTSKDKPEPPLVNAEQLFAGLDAELSVEPDELAQRSPEHIRHTIAALLNSQLASARDETEMFRIYREICERYDFAVDRSFYRSKQEKYRTWFGYKLESTPLGRGNFGEVYSAQSPEGDLVAVKIMHKNIFDNNDMLAGFRRGVRSMNIVTRQGVNGMIPIICSYELPPTIVMPYVTGSSLEEAIESGARLEWLTKLDMAVRIGQIVRDGHALPQTVLHRDLKPSNIMISNMEYDGPFAPEIVVLDFDMSWHKGSKEKDIVFESRDDFGYLSPEQTDKGNIYSARSTRVDSYGFGMTLFYLFGHEAPRPNEALSEHWQQRAVNAVRNGYQHDWKSAPNRLGRLISRATAIEQNLRVDFATIVHELQFLRQAVADPGALESPELWAEEVLCQLMGQYDWDDAVGKGIILTRSGIRAEVQTNFRNNSIVARIGYMDQGFAERSTLGKYLGASVESADRVLRGSGWQILDRATGSKEASVRAEISVEALRLRHREAFIGVTEAFRLFQI